jgi:hypothetical protein
MKKLYHVCAFIETDTYRIWTDGMYAMSRPNLADGWLPKLRETIRNLECAQKGLELFPVENVTIMSISDLGNCDDC